MLSKYYAKENKQVDRSSMPLSPPRNLGLNEAPVMILEVITLLMELITQWVQDS